MGPFLTVVVCTYNRQELLPLCLASLADQTLQRERYEVLVVNNNSTDGTGEVAESFSRLHANFRSVFEPSQGLSHARNRGFREARGKVVAYLDDDARAHPQWCERIVSAFHSVTPSPDAVGGDILPWYEGEPPAWFSDELETRNWGDEAGFLPPVQAKFGFCGSNMAFLKELLQSCGGFTTGLGMSGAKVRFGEETELFSRLHKTGARLWYDPALVVRHFVPLQHMRLSYRVRRSYLSGVAQAQIEGRKTGGAAALEALFNLAGFAARSLAGAFTVRSGYRKYAALLLKDLSGRLGYFFGRI